MLSPRALEILKEMHAAEAREDWEDSEIVCSGIDCWLGLTRVARRTVTSLVRHMAVSLASEPGSEERYVLSGTGRKILEDPAVADRVLAALLTGQPVDEAGNPIGNPGRQAWK